MLKMAIGMARVESTIRNHAESPSTAVAERELRGAMEEQLALAGRSRLQHRRGGSPRSASDASADPMNPSQPADRGPPRGQQRQRDHRHAQGKRGRRALPGSNGVIPRPDPFAMSGGAAHPASIERPFTAIRFKLR